MDKDILNLILYPFLGGSLNAKQREYIKTNLEVNGSNPHTITKRPVRRLVFEFEEID